VAAVPSLTPLMGSDETWILMYVPDKQMQYLQRRSAVSEAEKESECRDNFAQLLS
jgi:hypothetical protein